MSPGLAPYPGPDDRERELPELAAAHGVELITYGSSVEGRPLQGIRAPGPGPDAPRLLVTANIHGPEFIGNRVATAFLSQLLEGTSPAARLRERAEVLVLPCLNPDGYARTWELAGRAALAVLRCNARGVDLNRNFPLPRGKRASRLPGAGSTEPGKATYRGEAPLSEPETRQLAEFIARERPLASLNLHSFMGTLIPAHVEDRPSFAAYARFCRAFRRAQPRWGYRRIAARWLDVYTGELEDYQHHHHGVWASCVEVFPVRATYAQHLRPPSLFWRFNPRDPTAWIANDVPGMVAFFEAAIEEGRPTLPG